MCRRMSDHVCVSIVSSCHRKATRPYRHIGASNDRISNHGHKGAHANKCNSASMKERNIYDTPLARPVVLGIDPEDSIMTEVEDGSYLVKEVATVVMSTM